MAQQQNNYFTQNIQRWGDNFIWQMKPEQIQRDAKNKIFREMIQGRIDYSKYGSYYLDPKFLENLIICASNELSNNITIYNALDYYDINRPGDVNVVSNKTKFNGLIHVYQNLLTRLNAVKTTGDIGNLVDIQYVLGNFRNLI